MIRMAACIVAATALLSWPSRGQSPELHDSGALKGRVRDSHGRVIAGATVYLQLRGNGQTLTSHTDADGIYHFDMLRGGTYSLRAETSGHGAAALGPFVLGSKETKKVDLTLESAFFDEPKFVVAGVTQTATSGGVHGSNTVWRSAEALAQATVSLGKEASGVPATASSAADMQLREAAERDEKMGNALQAVREYQRAAEMNATEPNLFNWGAELLRHRASEPAAEVFTKGNGLFPGSVRMLLGLGAAWYARGFYDEAARRFFEASDLNPSDPRPYMFLGKVQNVEITQLEGYAQRMDRFVKLQPGNAWANYYCAVSRSKQRKGPEDSQATAEVQALLEKAVHLDPNLGAAYLQLGILYSDGKDFSRAIPAYRKAIEVSSRPEDTEAAHYRLAQAYRQTGDRLSAQKELEIYQQVFKDSTLEAERERGEIQQFIVTLRDGTSARP